MKEEYLIVIENELNSSKQLLIQLRQDLENNKLETEDICNCVEAINKLETIIPGLEHSIKLIKNIYDGTIRTHQEECN